MLFLRHFITVVENAQISNTKPEIRPFTRTTTALLSTSSLLFVQPTNYITMASVAAASASAPAMVCALPKPIDLTDKLEKSGCYARNEDSRFPWSNLVIGDTRLGCKSDADEQLILHFEFSEFVKVHSIKMTEFNNGTDPEQNPTRT